MYTLIILAIAANDGDSLNNACRASAHAARLGDDSFAARQAASKALVNMGPAALRALDAAAASKDAEVRKRAADCVRSIRRRQLNALGEMPWIDSLWFDTAPYHATGDPSRCRYCPDRVYFGRLCERYFRPYLSGAGGADGPPFLNYSRATEQACKDLLSAGVPAWVISPVLNVMRGRDEVFKLSAGWYKKQQPAQPPVKPDA